MRLHREKRSSGVRRQHLLAHIRAMRLGSCAEQRASDIVEIDLRHAGNREKPLTEPRPPAEVLLTAEGITSLYSAALSQGWSHARVR